MTIRTARGSASIYFGGSSTSIVKFMLSCNERNITLDRFVFALSGVTFDGPSACHAKAPVVGGSTERDTTSSLPKSWAARVAKIATSWYNTWVMASTISSTTTSGKTAGYERYLRSSKWRTKRLAILERDDYRCPCGSTAKEVHHLTYSRVGREYNSDLISVCHPCHQAIHADTVGSLRARSARVLGDVALSGITSQTRTAKVKYNRAPEWVLAERRKRLAEMARWKAEFKPNRPNVGSGIPFKRKPLS